MIVTPYRIIPRFLVMRKNFGKPLPGKYVLYALLFVVAMLLLCNACTKEVYSYEVAYTTRVLPGIQKRPWTLDQALDIQTAHCFVVQERKYIETILRHPIDSIWIYETGSGYAEDVKHFECQ